MLARRFTLPEHSRLTQWRGRKFSMTCILTLALLSGCRPCFENKALLACCVLTSVSISEGVHCLDNSPTSPFVWLPLWEDATTRSTQTTLCARCQLTVSQVLILMDCQMFLPFSNLSTRTSWYKSTNRSRTSAPKHACSVHNHLATCPTWH